MVTFMFSAILFVSAILLGNFADDRTIAFVCSLLFLAVGLFQFPRKLNSKKSKLEFAAKTVALIGGVLLGLTLLSFYSVSNLGVVGLTIQEHIRVLGGFILCLLGAFTLIEYYQWSKHDTKTYRRSFMIFCCMALGTLIGYSVECASYPTYRVILLALSVACLVFFIRQVTPIKK